MTIDVQVFHDKLEVLKEWMDIRIDYLHERELKHHAVMYYWKLTGILLWGNDRSPLTFEEFYNQRKKIWQH